MTRVNTVPDTVFELVVRAMAAAGHHITLITTNVDGLLDRNLNDNTVVIELHGRFPNVVVTGEYLDPEKMNAMRHAAWQADALLVVGMGDTSKSTCTIIEEAARKTGKPPECIAPVQSCARSIEHIRRAGESVTRCHQYATDWCGFMAADSLGGPGKAIVDHVVRLSPLLTSLKRRGVERFSRRLRAMPVVTWRETSLVIVKGKKSGQRARVV